MNSVCSGITKYMFFLLVLENRINKILNNLFETFLKSNVLTLLKRWKQIQIEKLKQVDIYQTEEQY